MKTPTTATNRDHSRRWRKPPGSIDTLNMGTPYPTTNNWEMPDLAPQPPDLTIPDNLFPLRYRQPIRTNRPILLHFHTDDYRFENLWREPAFGLRAAMRPQIWAACSPDYSLWLDYPYPLQIYNTYRNRWTAAHWQAHGITVIPSINWSDATSFQFAWQGIPQHQIITLRAYANNQPHEQINLWAGYQAMIDALQPRHILWFGQPSTLIQDDIPKTLFPIGGPPWAAQDAEESAAANLDAAAAPAKENGGKTS